ncbi:aconitate hydratase AcnA [Chloroflexota bacterium]
MSEDYFGTKGSITTSHGDYTLFRLRNLELQGLTKIDELPFSIRIMLESVLRQCNDSEIKPQDVTNLASWKPNPATRPSFPFRPARVIMQDFTGVPAIVDLAAMRAAISRLGGDPRRINPMVPVDLVIDHSVQVDFFASRDALQRNAEIEFQRNRERYEFLHWGQQAFDNFRVVPPATGIVHQVNLEYLAQVVATAQDEYSLVAYPDTLVGTDSHTTMVNSLGVAGWGVGGIEAEAAMLGQPLDMLTPDVVGFRLDGELKEGVTATDLTLTVVQMLRKKGVVGKFVEFFGPGLDHLSLPDRATIANMAPEYGATLGFFPVDDETLRYLVLTGRSAELIELVENYCKEQGLFRTENTPYPEFTDLLELDLSLVETSLAGPKRPQDRTSLADMQCKFHADLVKPKIERGFELDASELSSKVSVGTNGVKSEMGHGSVVIAAITSCTNTSNPSVMIGAGLLAKNAIEKGLQTKPYVKTSLAPGSRVVTDYLEQADLLEPLAELGFNLVGYGCTTCIGNSGPLPGEVVKAITKGDLVAAAVISGNRNFEGRVHPYVRANYLASPPLVVAYALAGTVDIDLVNDPIGLDSNGDPVYLKHIWPAAEDIQRTISDSVLPAMFEQRYKDVFTGNKTWSGIEGSEGDLYNWEPESTYIQEPPFFTGLTRDLPQIKEIRGARALAVLGDSITTDHISPAGAIPAKTPAGSYLIDHEVSVRDFNSFGSRRGNDQIMTRGTFANIRLKNQLVPGVEGGSTAYLPEGTQMSIYEAAMRYQKEGVPLVILAGAEYGTGSSRDWAAKGTLLLNVKAVIAKSFERIHRSNLVGMGVLPLQFLNGEGIDSLGLTGHEVFDILDLSDQIEPQSKVTVLAEKENGEQIEFQVQVRLDTAIDVDYYRNGGILHTVLRNMLDD